MYSIAKFSKVLPNVLKLFFFYACNDSDGSIAKIVMYNIHMTELFEDKSVMLSFYFI